MVAVVLMGYKWWPLRKPSVWAISDCWWRDVVLIFSASALPSWSAVICRWQRCCADFFISISIHSQLWAAANVDEVIFPSAAANDRSQSWFFINIIIITLRIRFQKIHYRKKYFQKKYFQEFVFSKIYTFGNHTFGKYIFGKYTFDKFTLIYLDIYIRCTSSPPCNSSITDTWSLI